MIGRLGHYDVAAHIGSGGMGDVYQATDTRLGRSVAIKCLPDAFARDPRRVARFEREARALASLNHPNIAAIHGLEECDGRRLLVMEFVPGETLDARIAGRPLPVDDALSIARQIAEALESAHEKGIVHRDLKPSNVKVTPDGRVKVLDFGLAKLVADDADGSGEIGRAGLADSPTLTMPATQEGVILGTAAYMAPEQAKGRRVDRRADIFAFGCVLYEMLTGRPAFEGESVADILSRVLRSDPDWTRLPSEVPASVHRLLRLCLEKDARERRQSAGDVRIDLDHAHAEPAIATAPGLRPPRALWLAAIVALLAVLGVPAAIHFAEAPPPEWQLHVATPFTRQPLEFALSPDGRYLAFVASASADDAVQRLYVRPLNSPDARPMAGTDGARYPFWSPDSRSVGFFASEQLHRIDIDGGPAQALASAPNPQGGAWSIDDTILFAPNSVSPLMRVHALGGAAASVTRLQGPNHHGHRHPAFLPDGRQFLLYVQGEPDVAGIYIGSLEDREPVRLTAADTAGVFLPPDRVVFVRQGSLVARRLDAARAELTGNPVTLLTSVASDGNFRGGFSMSANGIIAYRTGRGGAPYQTHWVDRSGNELGQVGGYLNGPELSPDERRLAGDRTVQGNRDIWIADLASGGQTHFTSHPAVDGFPIWSADGARVAFHSTRNGTFDIWIKAASGTGSEELLLETPDAEWPLDWSNDGRFLLYQLTDLEMRWDLLALPMTAGDRTPIVVARTPFVERMGQFSPDGRWIVYETNESGRPEIVAQAFPEPGARWPVSRGGGTAPRWHPNGHEVFFLTLDGVMMAAPVTTSDATFEAGTPIELFPTRLGVFPFDVQYAVTGDGRFLISDAQSEMPDVPPINVVLNWTP